jgi:hypothetical protein
MKIRTLLSTAALALVASTTPGCSQLNTSQSEVDSGLAAFDALTTGAPPIGLNDGGTSSAPTHPIASSQDGAAGATSIDGAPSDRPSSSTPADAAPTIGSPTGASCGNGVVETGEECDPGSSCPTACPNRGCTRFVLQGTAALCTAKCVESGTETICKSGDGCCPSQCNSNNDGDCSPSCGDGVIGSGETCDPPSQCASLRAACISSDDTVRTPMGDPGRCTFTCAEQARKCGPADGVCPPGCAPAADPDCKKPAGASCSANSDCSSSSCLDRFCCTQTCSPCQTCSGPAGTCRDISGMPARNGCPVPSNGRATCTNGQCNFECQAPRVACGDACVECCMNSDCHSGANEIGTCGTSHTCSFACRSGSLRCHGNCAPTTIGGACVVGPSSLTLDASWCDFTAMATNDRADFSLLLMDAKFWNPSPSAANDNCNALFDDMFLQYCGQGSPNPFGAQHLARMDTVFGYMVNFNPDGAVGSVTALPRPTRTCMPPP